MTHAPNFWPSAELFAETMSGFLWRTDTEGRFSAASEGFGKTGGLPIAEAIGRPLVDLIEGPADRRKFTRALADKRPFRDVTHRFWPARRWTRIGGAAGDGGHLGIAIDIDDERGRIGLVEGVLDRLPDAAAVYDREHRLVTFNEALYRAKQSGRNRVESD